MKKRYNMMLDEDVVKITQAWVKTKGITFSGYVNSLLVENAKAIETIGNITDIKDMSIGQFTKLFADMATEIEKSKKEKVKKK